MNSKRISVLLIGILLLYAPASVVGDTNGSDNSYTNYSTIDAEYVPQFGFSFVEVIISDTSDNISSPTDLEFHPGRVNELWVANKATDSITIVHDTGLDNQTSETRLDVNRNHFLEEVSAISFGSYHPEFDWQWGSAQESLNTYNGQGNPNYFMGPALWPSSLDHFAVENQNNEDGLLGSHIDMLHESPYGVGIAHDYDNVYWYNDGYYGELVRYDFMMDHDTGGHNHSDGVVQRYSEIQLNHSYGTPGHMVLDKETDILYISDAGGDRVIWVNTDDTTYQTENIMNDSSRLETLSEYSRISGVEWGVLIEGLNRPSGIALDGDQLFVSLNEDNSIVSYNLNSDGKSAVEVAIINTSASSIMGIEIGPKGHLFYVDNARDEVVRVDPVLDEDGDGYDNIEKNLWLSNGVIQWVDKFPNNSEEWNDTDDDGIGNNADLDDDNDGWSDYDEINCSYEGNSYLTENPQSIPKDTDGDGICEFLDYDDDNDGWSDEEENTCAYVAGWIGESSRTVDSSDYPLDTDGDGLCNPIDEDDDNDGRLDENDIFPLNLKEWSDNDNDGIGDNEDLDDDNDILTDKSEIENGTDPNNSDTDSDGYSDNNDIFPLDAKDWRDLDDDGVGDNTDIFPSISRYQYTSDLAIDILLISIMGIITLGTFSLFKRINREDW
ncbi:hypothetical protein OAQ40_02710 [Euryarchaeota archaeon]|nr:hypothetical protein [Euryarchaeota archaeon]MDC0851953.1 hypothetical protein [Euryarchaeota archaeon]